MRPMLKFVLTSTNQRLPSAPAVIVMGLLFGIVSGNGVTVPVVVIFATTRVPKPPESATGTCVSQRSPPGPAVKYQGASTGNSVMAPVGVTRPIRSGTISANQTFPSGPSVMSVGLLFAFGRLNSVIVPVGVIRPTLLPAASV